MFYLKYFTNISFFCNFIITNYLITLITLILTVLLLSALVCIISVHLFLKNK